MSVSRRSLAELVEAAEAVWEGGFVEEGGGAGDFGLGGPGAEDCWGGEEFVVGKIKGPAEAVLFAFAHDVQAGPGWNFAGELEGEKAELGVGGAGKFALDCKVFEARWETVETGDFDGREGVGNVIDRHNGLGDCEEACAVREEGCKFYFGDGGGWLWMRRIGEVVNTEAFVGTKVEGISRESDVGEGNIEGNGGEYPRCRAV